MGNSGSNELDEDTIQELHQNTRFSKKEIMEMHEKFKTDFPEGVITRDRFVAMYSSLFPGGDSTRFAKFVFRAYDTDGNGTIDFNEFMSTLSIASKGTMQEKLQWAFHLYDLNGDGSVSRPEATEMISAIYRMQGVPGARDKAEQAALQLFIHLDKNKDDSLSQAEFVTAVQGSSVIRELLQGAT